MKKIIIAVLFIALLGGAIYYTAQNKNKDQTKEPTCEVVDPNGHIYRGQCLPEDYVPKDLVPLSRRASWLNTKPELTLKGKVMVEQLIESAEADGMCLVVTSGYRSYEDQKDLYNKTPEDKKDFVAEAGSSEHQTGLAVDFAACPMDSMGRRNDSVEREELEKRFEELPEYEWLQDNAKRYGFEQSFREDNIEETVYPVESWHWKFVGKDL